MGALRNKAEAEVRAREAEREERKAKEEARRIEEHREHAKPVAEFLTRWSGEQVETTQLKREDKFFGGFHSYMTWLVTLDDFDLVVKQERRQRSFNEEHGPKWAFEIHQLIRDDETRKVGVPADLLDPVPNPVEQLVEALER